MSKYGDLIKKAREPENQETINTENQKSGLPEQEQLVNLCIKVPIKERRYWMSKAKEQGITVTSVIIEALNQKFGKPDSQKTKKPD
ncbi:hypothetical protein [Nodularia sp. UHCC 0506]|uniref:hypothetical protein n=1 Tax=Nodularia sp. UHCC 0506 TaxID=3110243 RepID=UPI002B20AECE|nr:hypothetical protein [Nodularia sp. UHCC 0506]MEA5517028.1 hypothetical protein [Nodularia sp. UHCC 0506]